MLYDYLMSNISYAKIGPLFYFMLNDVESLNNKSQQITTNHNKSLLLKLPTDEKSGQTYPIFGLW